MLGPALIAATLAATAPLPAEPVRIRTLVQGWYAADEAEPDGFRMRRLNVALMGEAAPGLGYFAQLNFARALAPPDDKWILDAFTRYRLAGVELQAGQFRIPLSSDALEAAADLVTIRRARFNESPTQFGFWRDVGLQARGRPWPWLELTGGVFNGEGMNQPDRDHRKDVVGRAVFEPGAGLRVAAAHAEAALGPAGPVRRRTSASLEAALGPVVARAEALAGQEGAASKLGWLTQLAGRPRPDMELVARWESWDPDQARAQLERAWTLGASWQVGPWWGEAPANDARVALNLIRLEAPVGVSHTALAMWQVMR